MCGLVAVACRNFSNDEFRRFEEAHEIQASRGLEIPSCQRIETNGYGAIGHNTLPLVNAHPADYKQPFVKADSLSAFVGEIFNWKLFNKGSYRTDAQMFDQIPDLLEVCHEFDGFWSYVKLDADGLFAMTDFLSIKPLYYRTDINAVASTIEALAVLEDTRSDEIYYANVSKWGYDPTGRTPYEEIKQLPPGCYYLNGYITKYWNWSKVSLSKDLASILCESVQNRLTGISDIAILLSGGIDSSLIHKLAESEDVFTESFHVENDEASYAKIADPHVQSLSLDDVTLIDMFSIHECPVDLGSTKQQIALSKAVSEKGYRVMLTGDGADELFGGYRRAKEYDSQASDIFCELPYYHLPKLDRCSSAFTIELRAPFLSPKVILYAMHVPRPLRTDKQEVKRVANEVGVDDQIINRLKKPLRDPNMNSPVELVQLWRRIV